MSEIAAALEATALAQFLKTSAWIYPLVNAGHLLGIALLVGAVLPMDVSALRGRPSAIRLLRPWAVAGFLLAAACGAMLFATQATDYVENSWFLAKIGVLAAALLNAAFHFRRVTPAAALGSMALWPTVLVLGRMVGYS